MQSNSTDPNTPRIHRGVFGSEFFFTEQPITGKLSANEGSDLIDAAAFNCQVGTGSSCRLGDVFRVVEAGGIPWLGFDLKLRTTERTGSTRAPFLWHSIPTVASHDSFLIRLAGFNA